MIYWWGVFSGMLLALLLTLTFPEHTTLYKVAQIDAMSGKVRFELVQQPDGSTKWERKK